MSDPATCRHNMSYSDLAPEGLYLRSCECGITSYASTYEDARRLFWSKAEQARVEGLMERQRAGERLTEAERRAIGYSPFGTGAAC